MKTILSFILGYNFNLLSIFYNNNNVSTNRRIFIMVNECLEFLYYFNNTCSCWSISNISTLGIGLGILLYSYFIGPINLSSLGFDINYFLFYQVFFSTIIGLLFAYRKRVSNIIKGNIGLKLRRVYVPWTKKYIIFSIL